MEDVMKLQLQVRLSESATLRLRAFPSSSWPSQFVDDEVCAETCMLMLMLMLMEVSSECQAELTRWLSVSQFMYRNELICFFRPHPLRSCCRRLNRKAEVYDNVLHGRHFTCKYAPIFGSRVVGAGH